MQGVNQAKDDVQDLCRRGQEFLLRGQEMRVYLWREYVFPLTLTALFPEFLIPPLPGSFRILFFLILSVSPLWSGSSSVCNAAQICLLEKLSLVLDAGQTAPLACIFLTCHSLLNALTSAFTSSPHWKLYCAKTQMTFSSWIWGRLWCVFNLLASLEHWHGGCFPPQVSTSSSSLGGALGSWFSDPFLSLNYPSVPLLLVLGVNLD